MRTAQAAAVGVFLRFRGLSVLAFEVGEGHVLRFRLGRRTVQGQLPTCFSGSILVKVYFSDSSDLPFFQTISRSIVLSSMIL
jgi:hypothetical protein